MSNSNALDLDTVLNFLETYYSVIKLDYYIIVRICLNLLTERSEERINHLVNTLSFYVAKVEKLCKVINEITFGKLNMVSNILNIYLRYLQDLRQELITTFSIMKIIVKILICLNMINKVLELIREELELYLSLKINEYFSMLKT